MTRTLKLQDIRYRTLVSGAYLTTIHKDSNRQGFGKWEDNRNKVEAELFDGSSLIESWP